MTHPDAHLFKPHSHSANLRQKIWNFLRSHPDGCYTLSQLSDACKDTNAKVYAACKSLVIAGLAKRTKAQIDAPTKKDPAKKKEIMAISFIPEWSPGQRDTWLNPV